MMERESWERFWVSGRVEDYLLYAGMAEKPESSAVDKAATGKINRISGRMDKTVPGQDNMTAKAKQE